MATVWNDRNSRFNPKGGNSKRPLKEHAERVTAFRHDNDVKSPTSRLAIVGIQLLILLFGFAAKGGALAFFGS